MWETLDVLRNEQLLRDEKRGLEYGPGKRQFDKTMSNAVEMMVIQKANVLLIIAYMSKLILRES